MARQNYFQNSFASGEVSELLFAQKNFDRMRNACRQIRNLVCMPYGGVTARPGTLFVTRTKSLDPNIILVPFQFSVTQAYVLELGAQYARILKQTGLVKLDDVIYEIKHPYTSEQLPNVRVIQSNDVLIFTHPQVPPQRLGRKAETNWLWEEIVFKFPPLLEVNIGPITLTASAVNGAAVTVTASAPLFSATDVGRALRLTADLTNGDGRITAFQSPTSVTVFANSNLPTTATDQWRLGAWSQTTGYPPTACFYEDRLFFGGCPAEPQTIWGSVIGDYYNFTPGADASSALYLPLLARNYNAIQWLVPYKVLLAGTSSSLWPVSSSNFRDVALTPETARTVEEIAYGFEPVPPVVMNKSVIAVQLGGKRIREIAYSLDQDGFDSSDLTLLGEHMTGPGIKQMVVQTLPYEVLWCLRLDGILVGLTYQKDQNTIAWHQHDVGGTVNSITCIQSGQESQLWISVTRVLHGTSVQTIERLSPFFLRQDPFEAVQLDCATQISRIPAANIEIDPIHEVANAHTVTATASVFNDAEVGDLIQILAANEQGFMRPTENFLTITGVATSHAVTVTGSPSLRAVPQGAWALAQKTVSGLSHLEGMEVHVLADGADVGAFTINNGQISLERPAFKITVGLPYQWHLDTLDWEAGSQLGSSEGQFARITEANVRLFEAGTGYLKVMDGGSKGTLYHLRQTSTHYDSPQALFSGIETIKTAGGFDRQRHLRIGGASPLPWTMISLMAKVALNDT